MESTAYQVLLDLGDTLEMCLTTWMHCCFCKFLIGNMSFQQKTDKEMLEYFMKESLMETPQNFFYFLPFTKTIQTRS